jgi:hypothetical protein
VSATPPGKRPRYTLAVKTLLRSAVLLLVTLWLGGVMFFPVVAAVSFGSLPDAHAAGTVARLCLLALHKEGLVAGCALLVLLLPAGAVGAYGSRGVRAVAGPLAVTLVMLLLTAFSQFSIIPRMERLRLGVGGDMAAVAGTDPARQEFDRLHRASVIVEEGVLVAGLILIVLLAREPRLKVRRSGEA